MTTVRIEPPPLLEAIFSSWLIPLLKASRRISIKQHPNDFVRGIMIKNKRSLPYCQHTAGRALPHYVSHLLTSSIPFYYSLKYCFCGFPGSNYNLHFERQRRRKISTRRIHFFKTWLWNSHTGRLQTANAVLYPQSADVIIQVHWTHATRSPSRALFNSPDKFYIFS